MQAGERCRQGPSAPFRRSCAISGDFHPPLTSAWACSSSQRKRRVNRASRTCDRSLVQHVDFWSKSGCLHRRTGESGLPLVLGNKQVAGAIRLSMLLARSSRQRTVPGWSARNTKDAGKVAAGARNLLLAAASSLPSSWPLPPTPVRRPRGRWADSPRRPCALGRSSPKSAGRFIHGFIHNSYGRRASMPACGWRRRRPVIHATFSRR